LKTVFAAFRNDNQRLQQLAALEHFHTALAALTDQVVRVGKASRRTLSQVRMSSTDEWSPT
jgi:hypothetical protein